MYFHTQKNCLIDIDTVLSSTHDICYGWEKILFIYTASADPEGGGTGGLDPPWKITSYMGFYRE